MFDGGGQVSALTQQKAQKVVRFRVFAIDLERSLQRGARSGKITSCRRLTRLKELPFGFRARAMRGCVAFGAGDRSALLERNAQTVVRFAEFRVMFQGSLEDSNRTLEIAFLPQCLAQLI